MLTAELHCSAYLGVCQEAPAGLASERIPRVLLLELQVPVHLQSAQGRGLGDRPHHGRYGRCAHIFRTAPKVAERTRRLVEVAILDHQIPEACISWSVPEAMDSGLVAKFHVEVVRTWSEEEGLAGTAPLSVESGGVTSILSKHSVDRGLG